MRPYPEEFAEWQESLSIADRQRVDSLLASNIWVRDCIIRLFENVPSDDLASLLKADHRDVPAVTIATIVHRCIQSEYFSAAAGFVLKAWTDNGHRELVTDVLSKLKEHKERDLMNQFIHLPS